MSPNRRTLALLGDTHGYLDPRIRAVARECDLVVHTGDVGGRAILDQLAGPPGALRVVAGNNDTPRHWGDADPALIATLPLEVAIDLPGGRLVAVHGHRLRARDRHRRLRAAYPGAGAVVYGHSHRLCVDREALPWVLNPGAAGRARTYGGPSCLVLETTARAWTVTPYRFDPRRPGRGHG